MNVWSSQRRFGSALRVLIVALVLLSIGALGGPNAAAEEPSAERLLPRRSAAVVPIEAPLRGIVLARQGTEIVRVPGAHVGTGVTSIQADAAGRFTLSAEIRTNQLTVVAAGYRPSVQETTADYVVVYLEPLDVRGIYLPMDQLKRADTLDWVLGLARAGTISALVVDVKDEGGSVLPFLATGTAREIGAAWYPGQDLEAFLAELGDLGIYRIARVVTFLDSRFAYAFPEDAIRGQDGAIFVGAQGAAWTSAFSPAAQRYNVEIGVEAAGWFKEVQDDYVRLPTEPGIRVRDGFTSAERSAAITQFAQDAAEALHAVGAALAFDTFGQTTMIEHDGGIGQILEDLGPHLDYFSPMVYPSTWASGWFGLLNPATDPGLVVEASVARSVERLSEFPGIVVRPWLQDFPDYQAGRQPYGPTEVRAQIDANKAAGGSGFMLWDPSLDYRFEALHVEPIYPPRSAQSERLNFASAWPSLPFEAARFVARGSHLPEQDRVGATLSAGVSADRSNTADARGDAGVVGRDSRGKDDPSALTTAAEAPDLRATPAVLDADALGDVVDRGIPPLLAIGDSIMLSAQSLLLDAFDQQIVIDGVEGRSFAEGIPILEARAAHDEIPDTVIVHLGTNNLVYDDQFEAMMSILRDVPHVLFVNVRMPWSWEAISNATLRAGVARWPNASLLDWHQLVVDADYLFAPDGVHIGATGTEVYTQLLRDGVDQLGLPATDGSDADLVEIQTAQSE